VFSVSQSLACLVGELSSLCSAKAMYVRRYLFPLQLFKTKQKCDATAVMKTSLVNGIYTHKNLMMKKNFIVSVHFILRRSEEANGHVWFLLLFYHEFGEDYEYGCFLGCSTV
jgi:hypothetical protein